MEAIHVVVSPPVQPSPWRIAPSALAPSPLQNAAPNMQVVLDPAGEDTPRQSWHT